MVRMPRARSEFAIDFVGDGGVGCGERRLVLPDLFEIGVQPGFDMSIRRRRLRLSVPRFL